MSANAREERNWTVRVREYGLRSWPPERLLPAREPNYVASSLYVFGVVAISAFVTLVVTGIVLANAGVLLPAMLGRRLGRAARLTRRSRLRRWGRLQPTGSPVVSPVGARRSARSTTGCVSAVENEHRPM